MGFCKFTKSGRPASVSGDRKSLSLRGVPQGHLLRGAQRRGNPFFSCKETDSHASDAVTGVGMTGSGTSRTPSPTTVHRTRPQGGDAHTSPRRTNAHFAAGHMGPALQGTPVIQDGTSGTPSPTTAHRTHPQGDDAHTLPRRTNAHFAAGHMGPALQGTPVMQDGTSRTPSPTTAHRTRPQGTMPTAPRRQHKEAGASACQLVEKVRMDFFGKLAGKIAK